MKWLFSNFCHCILFIALSSLSNLAKAQGQNLNETLYHQHIICTNDKTQNTFWFSFGSNDKKIILEQIIFQKPDYIKGVSTKETSYLNTYIKNTLDLNNNQTNTFKKSIDFKNKFKISISGSTDLKDMGVNDKQCIYKISKMSLQLNNEQFYQEQFYCILNELSC